MSIATNIKNIFRRRTIANSEDELKNDLIKNNKDNITSQISQRRGMSTCSGLSIAERDYILADAMIASAIQLYLADIQSICSRDSYILQSRVNVTDNMEKLSIKEEKAKYILSQIFSDTLIEAIGLNLLDNGEIFLDTTYNEGLNKCSVVESSHTRCTQLCYSNGEVAGYVVSDTPIDCNQYTYNIDSKKDSIVEADKMVRIYVPTLVNSKVCIELDKTNQDEEKINSLTSEPYLYYTGSQSLLKQIYPDWLNSKLLELAVYRNRIAKSRFIQLIALELGKTSKTTSDMIYDNIKDYFDKRAVIDLEQQTFKSVVGNEPFTDYKVYITRNGNGALSFDNSLNGASADVSSLADLDYNLTKVFAGLGIPKQYLGADDNGSALSNGGSLFFMDEKYQKRVISYVKRIANGLKECVKNILIQQEGKEYFFDWDFDVEFKIPESNEDVYRVKNARLDYTSSLLELVDKIEDAKKQGRNYKLDAITDILQEDIKNLVLDNGEKENEN